MTTELTPGLAVDRNAARFPNRSALTDCDRQMSFADLSERSRIVAEKMRERGVRSGRLVVLELGNCADLFVLAIAALRIGAVPLPLSPRLAQAEREALLALADAAIVIRSDDLILSGGGEPFLGDVEPPTLKASASGGSTGRPKIVLSKLPGRFNPDASIYNLPTGGSHLVVAPLSNSGPFTLSLLALLRGTHLVIEERFDAERALTLIDRHSIDFAFLVPTMMARMLDLPPATRAACSLRSIAFIAHAGAKCSDRVKRDFIDWLGSNRVCEFYGGTEAQGSTWITGTEWLTHPGSVGRPANGCAIDIRDPVGLPLPPGEIGEIFMRPAGGPGSTYEYIGAEPHRAPDGFESIGDMGWLDEEGYLYVADRRTDLILRGGANVYPAEVELALEEHPLVGSAVVIGLPDADLGQRVHALVHPTGAIDEAALRTFVERRLSSSKRPASYEWIDHPLRDEGGKVRRSHYLTERTLSQESART